MNGDGVVEKCISRKECARPLEPQKEAGYWAAQIYLPEGAKLVRLKWRIMVDADNTWRFRAHEVTYNTYGGLLQVTLNFRDEGNPPLDRSTLNLKAYVTAEFD